MYCFISPYFVILTLESQSKIHEKYGKNGSSALGKF